MKKKLIVCICILLLLIFCKQTFNVLYSTNMVAKYDAGDYSVSADPLLIFNCFQPYIAHYNQGNIYYQNGDYEQAIEEYYSALEQFPPKYKECSIRINLALAMLGTLGDDYDKPDNIKDSIETLKEAKAVLLENDCATKSGDGHSKTAEKLKSEIEDILEELENQSYSESEASEDTSEDPIEEEEDTAESNIEEQLLESMADSYQEREETMQFMDELDMNINFDMHDIIW